MKTIRALVSILLVSVILTVQLTSAQTSRGQAGEELSMTLGFIMAQRLSLDSIRNEYADLAPGVQKAELEFKVSFGTAEENIIKAMKDILKDEYPSYNAKIKELLKQTSQIFNRDKALQFLAEVESRAKGNIPSPVLETLLVYQYKDRPDEEMSRGYTRIYRTKGLLKAKGLDFQIHYPISWKPKEGERPNIIQKFVSENGTGLEAFLILVRDIPIPPGTSLTPEEIDDFLSNHTLKQIIPPDGKFLEAKKIVLDNHKGAMMHYEQTVQRLDITLTIRTLAFITIYKNQAVFIQCMVTSNQGEESKIEERLKCFEPLFKMVANSFVIMEHYE